MALRNLKPSGDTSSVSMVPLKFSRKVPEMVDPVEPDVKADFPVEPDVDIDLREVYFLIMQFLSVGPFKRTYGQFWNELSEHQLLPRRYHAWYSRSGTCSGDEDDDGKSLPLCYQSLVERYPHIEKDHLVRLLKQLFLGSPQVHCMVGGFAPKAADVPTILGSGSFSLVGSVRDKEEKRANPLPGYLRWPHIQADQVRGLSLREIGGGFTKHHRASSVRAACYVIAKPSTLVQKMQIIKKMRGHQNAVYCAIFDRSGRYVITGSDDRLVKIWSMETAFCLASCRGHEGDITDLAVSSNNTLVASSSNDFIIRVWRLPDGLPISVLRGHTGAVTAIAFSPRPGSYQLLSSSDDGTCRIWDARSSQVRPRIYVPKPPDTLPGKSNDPSSNIGQQSHQILCCAYNANGTVFVTGSSDTIARVWNACKASSEDSEQPNHEMDALSGHENDVNYVQFSGCAVASRSSTADAIKEDNIPKFKNSWFTHDNIVTCSRDGSAIIWIPRSRRSHGKVGRWTRAYHLKVPPPPMPPQPPRGGPRQRFQPTPRGVNMIVWSLDNRFVLAAIMDCRICVWNASDGSLVHSLTGHSESTFVLDVHPFNPRIAMSAGYDGKTIIWDIWEGSPVRIYEVGRFKLVDGKFSPDGTSIILSDEVGQIFIIATGQGESQKDAQYDQFFLGDYRPLIQDANGNVLDQETQLVPYRRNVQDLLCDSSMIPYPDPYQSLYQKRRLGALGIEWRPPSVKFAVGPIYNNSSGDFQMLPILDLDRWVEPLPELLDAIDWEPENELQSDDNDSEYNVPEEYSSEGEHGSLSESSSGEPECSAEDSGIEHKKKDAPRRSKRKKHKSEVEVTTSSGRRVKRRNFDECDGTSVSRTHRKRKSKNGRLNLKKKSSKSKTLRPQRRAARNALNLFSKIGDSSEEEDDDQFESTSESESEFPDSNTQSIESESMHQSERKYPRDKAAPIDEFEDVTKPSENQANPGRRRLVLKLPLRDSKAAISVENPRSECRGVESMIDAIPKENSDASNLKGTSSSAFQPVESFGDISDTMMLETVKNNERGQVEKSDQCILSASHGRSTIKWGGVKARSCKRVKLSDTVAPDACLPSNANLDNPSNIRDDGNGHLKSEDENEMSSNSGNKASLHNNLDRKEWQCGNGALQGLDVASTEECPPEYNFKLPVSQNSSANLGLLDQVAVPLTCNGNIIDTLRHVDNKYQYNHDISEASGIHEPIKSNCVVTDDKRVCDTTGRNQEVERNTLIFRIKANEFTKETNSLSSKSKYAVEDSKSFDRDLMSNTSPPAHQSSISVMPEENEGTTSQSPDHTSAHSPDHSDWNDDASGSLDSWEDKSHFSKRTHLDSHSKRYGSVYKRSKSSRGRRFPENDQRVEESTSKSYNRSNALVGSVHRTRSMGTKANATTDIIVSRREQFPLDDWKSNSKTVGLRSQRNRRESYSSNLGSIDKRKYEQPGRKLSWLMLVEHEESYHYIPQQGDIVAYLRQGHEEYIKDYHLPSKEAVSLKKLALKAVEICKVQQLDYSALPGSGESCCKLILEFIESSSNSSRKTFKLTLPELVSFPDFLVEKKRYDAAIARNWTYRDKCQVWWRNEVGDGGSWWEGRILAVKPRSPDLPESPWERYVVQYKNDSSGQHSHSPWELHDADTQWEHPHINVEIRDNLFSLISKLEETSIKKDKYGIQKLNQVAQKSDFLNRFPVPLSIDIIKRRLQNNYYRSLEAVKHDASVMLSNAESYFGKTGEMATKMRRLSVWFADTFSSL